MPEPQIDLHEIEQAVAGKIVTNTGNSGQRQPLLKERWKTHGDFKENARLSQGFKKLGHESPGWNKMTDTMKEAFDQEMLKWSRILSGRADSREHWEDLAGYTNLILEELR